MEYFIYSSLLILGGIFGYIICLLEREKPKVHKYTPINYQKFCQEIARAEGDGAGGERDLNIAEIKHLIRIIFKVLMRHCKHARLDFIRKYGRQ